MHGATIERPLLTKKSWSRSTSLDHNRSVSICNIPNMIGEITPVEAKSEFNQEFVKCIDNDEIVSMSESFSKVHDDSSNPSHLKAHSEDLPGKDLKEKINQTTDKISKSIWMSSGNTMFFYQFEKNQDSMEVIAEKLNENIRLEDEVCSNHNI